MNAKRLATAAAMLLTAAAFSAGAARFPRSSPDDLRRIRTVAVISAVGNTFLFQHVRDAPLEWLGPPDSHFLEISDWGIDASITKAVTAALGKRFEIKPVVFEPADFSAWDHALLRRATLNLNCDPGIDAFVLVLRDWRGDEIGHSVHALGGLGLYRRDEVRKEPRYGVFASYRVVVVNALTGNIIASRPVLLPDGTLPWHPVKPAIWPKTQDDLDAIQRATLAEDEKELVRLTLVPTLEKMRLASDDAH